MKKYIFLILIILALSFSRDLGFRRLNNEVLINTSPQQFVHEAETLKDLSSYDLSQAFQNGGRQFIRGDIIFP